MFREGFSNDEYTRLQSEHINERLSKFGGKLYLEFGGKLFDDYHASRVLPGFKPDSKVQMLLKMKDQAEIVIVINSGDRIAQIVFAKCEQLQCLQVESLSETQRGDGGFGHTGKK